MLMLGENVYSTVAQQLRKHGREQKYPWLNEQPTKCNQIQVPIF